MSKNIQMWIACVLTVWMLSDVLPQVYLAGRAYFIAEEARIAQEEVIDRRREQARKANCRLAQDAGDQTRIDIYCQ